MSPRVMHSPPFVFPRFLRPLSIVFTATLLYACGGEPEQAQPQRPESKVSIVIVQPENAVQLGDYAARLRSTGQVEVRAQVGGILEQRLYSEGQLAEKGSALFQIDSEPYALALRRAEAELAEATAKRLQAERDLHRARDLFARKVTSEHDKETAESAMQVAVARLSRAQSAVDDARRLLRYSRVQAPVTGITTLEAVAEGNLVQPGTLLTTLVPQDPIEVHFTVPAQDARLRRSANLTPAAVTLHLDDGSVYGHAGTLTFTASQIDPETDTVRLRAVFPNPTGELLPGQFARVQVPLREFRDVFVIEPAAVSEGPLGPQVFTVGAENKALAKAVELGPVLNGRQVVLSGLRAGDQLVVNGHVALQSGRPVAAVTKKAQP